MTLRVALVSARAARALDEDLPPLMRALESAGLRPDYFSVRTRDLDPPLPGSRELVVLAAARLGRARLIDNVQVSR